MRPRPASARSQVGRPAGSHEVGAVSDRRAAPAPRRCGCGGIVGPSGECAACRPVRDADGAGPRPARRPAGAGQHPSRAPRSPDEHDLTDVSARHASAHARARSVAARAFTTGSHFVRRQNPPSSSAIDPSLLCISAADPTRPQEQPFSPRERARTSAVLWQARSMAGQALMALGREDPYLTRVAERLFRQPVSSTLMLMNVILVKADLDNLALDDNLVRATCDDEVCGGLRGRGVAWTTDDLSQIRLCPIFFGLSPMGQVTTLVHEAGHMARLDPNFDVVGESYCRQDEGMDFEDPCPMGSGNLLENVDAWATFIRIAASS